MRHCNDYSTVKKLKRALLFWLSWFAIKTDTLDSEFLLCCWFALKTCVWPRVLTNTRFPYVSLLTNAVLVQIYHPRLPFAEAKIYDSKNVCLKKNSSCSYCSLTTLHTFLITKSSWLKAWLHNIQRIILNLPSISTRRLLRKGNCLVEIQTQTGQCYLLEQRIHLVFGRWLQKREHSPWPRHNKMWITVHPLHQHWWLPAWTRHLTTCEPKKSP